MLHCSYNSTGGVPVLSQHPYEYNEGNSNQPLHVDINIQSQQSSHPHPSSQAIPRSASGHSTLLHSSAPVENNISHSHQYPFPPLPLQHQSYSPPLSHSTSHIYSRPEHVGYLPNSPNMPTVSSNGGLPFISKTHQHHANARRSAPLPSGNDFVPMSNRPRLESTSGSSKSFPPPQTQSEISDVTEATSHLQLDSEGTEGEAAPPATCTAFISKLYHLCSHGDYSAFIRWTGPGDAFILAHANTDFASIVLPKFFRHGNVSSFIRQLNLYNFTRLPVIKLLDTIDKTSNNSPACAFSGFSHPCFRRGDVQSLKWIKPKPSKSKAARKAVKSASTEDKINKPLRRVPPPKPKTSAA